MKSVIEISEGNFKTEVLQAETPVVVDFYAEWCGPCKMLGPFLEQLSGKYQGQIKFAKVNVDHAPELATEYQVTGVPMLAMFRDGRLVDTVVGLRPPGALKSWLENKALRRAQALISNS